MKSPIKTSALLILTYILGNFAFYTFAMVILLVFSGTLSEDLMIVVGYFGLFLLFASSLYFTIHKAQWFKPYI